MIKDYDGRRHADGNPHTQLPRQLAHSGPVAGGFNIAQDLPPQPLTLPGALGQLCQEHTVTQPVSFVPGHSYRLSADGSNYRHRVTVTRACVSALARWRDLFCLKQGVILDTVHRRKVVTTDASNKGWGALCEGKPTFLSLVQEGVGPAHQLPRNASSVPGLSILPAGHTGTPCASKLRKQVRGVIHKSLGRPRLEATLQAGERPSCVGSEQSALTEGDACAGQDKPWSRHVVKEQRLLRGMDAPPARGSEKSLAELE